MTQNPGPPPCMQVGTNQHGGTSPASLAGTGNVWRWVASSTDTEGATYKTAKYGAGTGSLATHLINYTHSFANDLLLNTTGFYTLGMSSSNINSTVLYSPGTHVSYSPYIVYEKGVYDPVAHTYTQVIARPMTTTPTANIAQFAPGVVYNFAVAAFSGGPNPIPAGVPAPAGWTAMADTDMTKSISTWVTVEFSGLAPGASSATTVTAPASTVTQTTTTTATATTTATSTATTSVVSTTTATSVSTATATTTSVSTSTLTSPTTVVSTVTSTNTSITSFQTSTAAALAAMLIGLIAGMVAVGRLGRKGP